MIERDVREALVDRLEGWELVEFLQLSTEEIIDLIEDRILDKLEEVKEFAGITNIEYNDNE